MAGFHWCEDLGSGSGEAVSDSVTSKSRFAHCSPSGLGIGANSLMHIECVHA